jgi:hypothetical protein
MNGITNSIVGFKDYNLVSLMKISTNKTKDDKKNWAHT